MKSTAVDESLSSMNQQFCSRENQLLQMLQQNEKSTQQNLSCSNPKVLSIPRWLLSLWHARITMHIKFLGNTNWDIGTEWFFNITFWYNNPFFKNRSFLHFNRIQIPEESISLATYFFNLSDFSNWNRRPISVSSDCSLTQSSWASLGEPSTITLFCMRSYCGYTSGIPIPVPSFDCNMVFTIKGAKWLFWVFSHMILDRASVSTLIFPLLQKILKF